MEVIDVPRRLQFDSESLRLYLARRLQGFSCDVAQLKVRKYRYGESNPTYHLQTSGGSQYVLRRRPPGKLLPGAHRVDREFRILSVLHSVNFPVPRPLLLCQDPQIIGTEFYVMEHVEGRVFRDINLPEASPAERHALYVAMVTTLVQLHTLDWKELGLDDFGKKGEYAARQVSVWSNNYRKAVVEGEEVDPAMDNLIKSLTRHTPTSRQPTSIIHGDYRIDNIIFHPTEPRVLAVLDWELCTIGCPLVDIAQILCFCLYTPGETVYLGSTGGSIAREVEGAPTKEDVERLYCALARIPYPQVDMPFYKALSYFRLAAIAQGVYARGKKGNASSSMAAMYKSVVNPMAEKGLSFLDEKASIPSVLDFVHYSSRARETLKELKTFMKEHVYPKEMEFYRHVSNPDTMWTISPLMEEWKEKARQAGLWNLFLPGVSGFTQLEYAPMAEEMGRLPFSPEIFNCSAPDTGNMEVLHLYGSESQKKQWLEPLLRGEFRSCFSMTEPEVASSDATNIETTITRQGNSYIVNGVKWWSSGAGDPRCKVAIVMGVTNPQADRTHRHGMILVPLDSPGVTIVRPLTVFGYVDAPHGHMEIQYKNVRVPAENLILGEGRGFEIAQGRLGPGRIHHCMRMIGMAERGLEIMVARAAQRKTFGRRLLRHQTVRMDVAESRLQIDQCRLLVLKAAHAIDCNGTKAARKEIAAIKVAAAQMACDVLDRAIQVHGGMGVCQDTPLAHMYAGARSLRIADGPDVVHMETVAKLELQQQLQAKL